ncbi:MAG: peptidase S41, partial [Acaryochloris sp. RU_4_1]|nr:peptidase S41 [Acaryochloris sp. RU_4_1]NJR56499.1 peptidase S41 [Acaryochloris sp. CRU_2_0]
SKTFGKGLVQSVHPLQDGSGLAVTVAKYFTPKGRDINKKGIEPDIKVQLTDKQREVLSQNRNKIGTLADPQYAKALAVLNERIMANRKSLQSSSQ